MAKKYLRVEKLKVSSPENLQAWMADPKNGVSKWLTNLISRSGVDEVKLDKDHAGCSCNVNTKKITLGLQTFRQTEPQKMLSAMLGILAHEWGHALDTPSKVPSAKEYFHEVEEGWFEARSPKQQAQIEKVTHELQNAVEDPRVNCLMEVRLPNSGIKEAFQEVYQDIRENPDRFEPPTHPVLDMGWRLNWFLQFGENFPGTDAIPRDIMDEARRYKRIDWQEHVTPQFVELLKAMKDIFDEAFPIEEEEPEESDEKQEDPDGESNDDSEDEGDEGEEGDEDDEEDDGGGGSEGGEDQDEDSEEGDSHSGQSETGDSEDGDAGDDSDTAPDSDGDSGDDEDGSGSDAEGDSEDRDGDGQDSDADGDGEPIEYPEGEREDGGGSADEAMPTMNPGDFGAEDGKEDYHSEALPQLSTDYDPDEAAETYGVHDIPLIEKVLDINPPSGQVINPRVNQQEVRAAVRQVVPLLRPTKKGGIVKRQFGGQKFDAGAIAQQDYRYFGKKRKPKHVPSAAILVRLDSSYSMHGDSWPIVIQCLADLHAFCYDAGIPFSIYQDTSYNTVEVIRTLPFDVTYSPADAAKKLWPYMIPLHNNHDGVAMAYMAPRLLERPEEVKIMVNLSDGAPSGSGYPIEFGMGHTARVAAEIEKSGITMIHTALDGDDDRVHQMFPGQIRFVPQEQSELPKALVKAVKTAIKAHS